MAQAAQLKAESSKPRHNKRIREGDTVIVTTGNEKGRTGTVLSRTKDRVVVQGLNVRKKHVKRSQENPEGGILSIEAPMHISNVSIVGSNGKAVKLRARMNNGEKELYYSENGKDSVYRLAKKKAK